MSAVTAVQLTAALKAADVTVFSFRGRNEMVTRVLLAAWPAMTGESLPDEALAVGVRATYTSRSSDAESILAVLAAAAPHMPA